MAIKYLAGNRLTGTNSERTNLASSVTDYLYDGTLFLELGTNDMYKWDKTADAWELVTGNAAAENFSNKTFTDHITVSEISAPSTPSSGKFAVYAKSDSKLYGKSDGGVEYDLTVGAGYSADRGGNVSPSTGGDSSFNDNNEGGQSKMTALGGGSGGGASYTMVSIGGSGGGAGCL